MLKIYICEDNEKQLKRFVTAVEKTLLIEELDMKLELATSNPHELLDYKKEDDSVGLYFFDLDLGSDIDGFKLAREIRKMDPRSFIAFITTNSSAAHITFQYKIEAMDYILKDAYDDIEKRIHSCIVEAYSRYNMAKDSLKKVHMIKAGDRIRSIDVDAIIAIETSSKEHRLILYTKESRIEYYGKLSEELKKLGERFIRGNRSYILNLDCINEVDTKDKCASMINGQKFYLSPTGLRELKKKNQVK